MGSNETRCSSASCGSHASADGARNQFTVPGKNRVRTLAFHAALSSDAAVAVIQELCSASRSADCGGETPPQQPPDDGATLICCGAGRRLFFACLDQFHIEAERLQLADQ